MHIDEITQPSVGAGLPCPAPIMNFTKQDRSSFVTPEYIRCAQCKLREGSVAIGTEILRFAQDDNTGFGRESALSAWEAHRRAIGRE